MISTFAIQYREYSVLLLKRNAGASLYVITVWYIVCQEKLVFMIKVNPNILKVDFPS